MVDRHHWLTIFLTLLVAFMLTLLPMPEWAIWSRPAWILMVLIYWAMAVPYRVGVGTAWVVGLLLDVLNGTLMGEHALAMTFVVFLVIRSHTQLRMFLMVQQGLAVLALVFLYQFIIYCVQGFLGDLPTNWLYWTASFTSMLVWPWVYTIMRDCQYRFKVT